MIKTVKRISDRMLAKLVPGVDAHACADVCEDVFIDGRWCCKSPCSIKCY